MLAFILGFLLALIIVVGAVAGGVYYALNYKLDKLAFNKDENNNYIYVNADPNGETANVLQLVKKVLAMTKDTSKLTIGQIEETFPFAGSLSDKICDSVAQYVEIDKQALKQTAFSGLGDFMKDAVMEVRPAVLLDSFGGNLNDVELLKKVLYDENDNPVTLRDITDGTALDNLYSTPVLEILSGDEGYDKLTYELLEDMTVGDFLEGVDFTDKVNALSLSSFINVTLTAGRPEPSEAILAYIVYGLSDITETAEGEYSHTCVYNAIDGEKLQPCYIKTENGKITGVFYDGEEIEGTKVAQISKRTNGIMNDLTIGQIIDVSGNKILSMMGGSTIASLADDINGLAVNELYAENIYSASTDVPEENIQRYLAVTEIQKAEGFRAGWIYYLLKDGKYELASTTGKLEKFEEGVEYYTCGEGKILFDAAYIYYGEDGKILNKGQENAGKVTAFEENLYTYGAANAMWKLLLYSGGSEVAFSVNGFMKMIDNVSENIESATIYELDEAGIIDMSANKDSVITIHGPNPETDPYGKKIGELTLEQLLDFFSYIVTLTTLPSVPNLP